MGYVAEYEPYKSLYLVGYPGAHLLEKFRDIIFHEEAIAPAMPTLYCDDNASHKINEHIKLLDTTNIPVAPPAIPERLFIHIPL